MPADDGVWLDDNHSSGPARPDPRESDPESEVIQVEEMARRRSAQGGELLAEGEIFECEFGASAESGMPRFKKAHEQGGHGWIMQEGR